MKFKVRNENGTSVLYFEEEVTDNSNENYCVPSGIFQAAYPNNYATENNSDIEEKDD